eukprot:6851442-Pyramimonas_sp.AAC.1
MEVCDMIREHARVKQLGPLTVADRRLAAAVMKPGAGPGIDQMSPLDFERPSDCGLAELREAYRLVEELSLIHI